ncbi:MAG: lipase family protein [Planctomycetes bacterium]|nr:lipase family protein [Planctomycetota bacterium]
MTRNDIGTEPVAEARFLGSCFHALCLAAAILLGLPACNSDGGGDDAEGPDLAAFDLDTALELCRLSLRAYQQLEDFEASRAFTLPAPYQLEEELATDERYAGETFGDPVVPVGFIATRGESIFLAFRGTSTVFEWIQDAKIAQVDYTFVAGGGLTEQGFTEIYASLRDDVLAKIDELAAGDSYSKLYVTGHSLGGALAVLAAPDLIENGPVPSVFMYNFGAPRVGDPDAFVPLYDTLLGVNSWRIVNTRDAVTDQPPTLVVLLTDIYRYEHVASEYAITFGKRLSSALDLVNLSANHSICNYHDALCALTGDPAACEALAAGIAGCD